MADDKPLYLVTPTIESGPISRLTGLNVYLKLENLQPPCSFKIRGISNFCKKAVRDRGCSHLYCASGGNAGLATAYAAQKLNVPATIVIPETSPAKIATSLRELGAEVVIHGKVFDHAQSYAQELAKQPGCEYVHPFDNPDVWEGHESMIKEAAEQMPVPPDVLITCVGGGGLLCGIIQGMHKVGWNDVPVIAMETAGANCFSASVKAGKPVTLPDITSVAVCLGALCPCPRVMELYKEHNILPVEVGDREAINACLKFADDHRMVVEPACGAALSALYSGIIPSLQEEKRLGDLEVKNVLAIVCGGGGVSLEMLQKWKKQFDL